MDAKGVQSVALSLPRVLGARGVLAALPPSLPNEEHTDLQASARILKEATNEIGY